MQVDVVVVGGGAMGSAAAWQLARSGRSVVLLEQFEAGHHIGASHGATRNFNTAYAEADYLDLLAESKTLWDELAAENGAPLLDLVGLANHGNLPRLQQIREAHEARGIESYFISADEAANRWLGMNFATDVLFVPGSGRIRSADALAALRKSAEAHGAVFKYSTPVRDIRVTGGESVVVVTEDTEYTANRVVVTAGAWTPKLIGKLTDLPALVVTQEQPAHFTPTDNTFVWPSFNHSPDPGPNNELRVLVQPRLRHAHSRRRRQGRVARRRPGHGSRRAHVRAHPPPDGSTGAVRRRVASRRRPFHRGSHQLHLHHHTQLRTLCWTASVRWWWAPASPVTAFKFTPAIGRVLKDIVDGGVAPERFLTPRPVGVLVQIMPLRRGLKTHYRSKTRRTTSGSRGPC
jgi:sarcosine oxidase